MKAARAYRREDGWYLSAVSTTTVGVGMVTAPFIKLGNDTSAEILGRAVLDALSGSKLDVPHPALTVDGFRPMLELAGVKTWATFSKQARSVAIRADGEQILIEPWKNAGAKEGFVQVPTSPLTVRADVPCATIGEALQQAIECCDT